MHVPGFEYRPVRTISLGKLRAETIFGCFTCEIQNAVQNINEGEFWHVTEFITLMRNSLDVERYRFEHIQ
jgi:hypothetical protein